ncbi:response regulator [Actinocrispum sp. NPDC049592]|uniref:response regulator n=1 Tax=Actinocrispum sp. NPDC049592 TaxID=3154835 RepID=UPI003429E69D
MTLVLVVDDDIQIARALRINLSARGYRVAVAHDGAEALRAAAKARPDLVVLDLRLPGTDGISVISSLRAWTVTPIVVLSGRTDETTKIAALDAGADDYVTKPFGMDELLARIRAALRRSAVAARQADEPLVDTGSFSVDLGVKKVWRQGAEVHLTPTEWGMLELLVRNRGRLVTQKQLLADVWGPQYAGRSHYLRIYIAQLRQKLEPDPARPRHLITEPGMGYRLA